ncbi:MAG: flagellar hook-associated protein FlgL [Deltaproteobacteria bacterium]
MRVTEKMVFDTMRGSVLGNRDRLYRIQRQIAENRRIVQPSDDPRGAEQLVLLDGARSEISQFVRNLAAGKSFLEMTSDSLGSAQDLLVRARELAIQLSDDSYNAEDRADAAAEVGEIFQEMIRIANTRLGTDSLFSGFRTDAPAYDPSGAYLGDAGVREIRIGKGERIPVNLVGTDIFGTAASGLLHDLQELQNALAANDRDGIRDAIDAMDRGMETVSANRARAGARLRTLEVAGAGLQNSGLLVDERISELRDLDLAEAATNLKLQEAALEAAIQVAGRISSLTILDAVTR